MTALPSLRATQPAPGLPISISASITANSGDDYGSWGGQSLGVTLTSTPPTVFADLAYNQNVGFNNTFMDTEAEDNGYSRAAGTIYRQLNQLRETKLLRLDSNFVAGRYLWLLVWGTSTPSGSNAPLAVSNPYLIR
jgi:hypothetical protein